MHWTQFVVGDPKFSHPICEPPTDDLCWVPFGVQWIGCVAIFATMILVAYRHGFRPAELVDLRWDQVEFASGALHVRRVKRGTPSTHPILGDELRALRRLQREQEPKSPFVFTSERGAPFSTAGFARMVERAGEEARLGFKAHPHMLRHACGYA
ncbi:MAG: tyrosine-type recombinase/integrase, partial [Xanthobacteraceae bacterium]